jgi:murein DD-endopeptidase MepM/ murein hydrolase activator NlpD
MEEDEGSGAGSVAFVDNIRGADPDGPVRTHGPGAGQRPRLATSKAALYLQVDMHRSPAIQRRRAKVRRRDQIRRRRVVTLAVLVTLIVLAVWAAYAIPGQTPARVPQSAALPTTDGSPTGAGAGDVVVAQVDGLELVLPVARDVTTAVAYHPVDNEGTVPFTPAGDRLSGGSLGQRLADIFAGGGAIQYYLMDGTGGERSSSTAGLDVGAVPGSSVVSPADGKVAAIKQYSILGRYPDVEMHIQLARDSSLLLVITHLARPQVQIGDVVFGGDTVLGAVRGFPTTLDQALSRYTSDPGDHVQMMVFRVTPELAGL